MQQLTHRHLQNADACLGALKPGIFLLSPPSHFLTSAHPLLFACKFATMLQERPFCHTPLPSLHNYHLRLQMHFSARVGLTISSSHPIPIFMCKMQIKNELCPPQQLPQCGLHFALVARPCCIPGVSASFCIPTTPSLPPSLSSRALLPPTHRPSRELWPSSAGARDPSWRGAAAQLGHDLLAPPQRLDSDLDGEVVPRSTHLTGARHVIVEAQEASTRSTTSPQSSTWPTSAPTSSSSTSNPPPRPALRCYAPRPRRAARRLLGPVCKLNFTRGVHVGSLCRMDLSLGPLPRWVQGPTTRWVPATTWLVPHGTCWHGAQGLRWRCTRIGSYTCPVLCRELLDVPE
jgi:hypothetical protein